MSPFNFTMPAQTRLWHREIGFLEPQMHIRMALGLRICFLNSRQLRSCFSRSSVEPINSLDGSVRGVSVIFDNS